MTEVNVRYSLAVFFILLTANVLATTKVQPLLVVSADSPVLKAIQDGLHLGSDTYLEEGIEVASNETDSDPGRDKYEVGFIVLGCICGLLVILIAAIYIRNVYKEKREALNKRGAPTKSPDEERPVQENERQGS